MSRASAPQKNPNPKSALTPVTRKPRNFMTRMNKMIATMVRSIEALYTATRVPASLKAALVAMLLLVPAAHAASLLPNGEQTFLDDNGDPLAGGSVYFYIPTTSTPKNTWQDSGQVTLNTNPVVLDSAGRAIIYGSGSYRQVVKDSLGNTIWDQLTADPSGTAASWGGTSGGTANAQTVTAGAFSGNSGQVIWFLAGFTNTGSVTLTVGSNSPISVYKDLSTGPSPLTGGEIVANNVVGVVYEATAGRFHLIETPGFISTVPTTIASATTTNILGATTSQVTVSGTATITSLGTGVNRAPIFVKASGAFTLTYNATSLILPGLKDIPVAAGDTFIVVSDASSNATVFNYTRASASVPSNTGDPRPPGGRLTLTTGTPVLTANVTAATSVFYTPYKGSSYPSYDGTTWSNRPISELTLALDSNAAHTGYQQSGKNFDLCLYNDNGTDRLVSLPAWTSDTARASSLAFLNGILTNSGSVTAKYDTSASTLTIAANRCTYVGVMRASANGQTQMNANPAAASGGGNAQLLLWNYYNRVVTEAVSIENNSWTYATSTWRSADNNANNRVSVIVGQNEDSVYAHWQVPASNGSAAASIPAAGIGLDATNALATNAIAGRYQIDSNNNAEVSSVFVGQIGLGFHYLQALERSDTGTITYSCNGNYNCQLQVHLPM